MKSESIEESKRLDAKDVIYTLREHKSPFGEYKNTLLEKRKAISKITYQAITGYNTTELKQKIKQGVICYIDPADLEVLYEHGLKPLELADFEKTQDVEEVEELDERFLKEDLLEHIYKELDKDHKKDNILKLCVFLVSISAELPNPADHISMALKGDSSAGKDNLIKTVFKHFSESESFFLTRATRSELEDNLLSAKRVAFSEVNKHREKGANSDIVETIKQISEGGMDVMKKDMTGPTMKSGRFKTSQKTVLYGTTESKIDEELETRFMIGPVRGSVEKNRIIVGDTLDKAANVSYILENYVKKDSWIRKSLKSLDNEINVVIPFSPELKHTIDIDGVEKSCFDLSKERIKRDVKRLLSVVKSISWLYQKQRKIYQQGEEKYLFSTPQDFILGYYLTKNFLDLTYSGLDFRHQDFLEKIKESQGKYVDYFKKKNVDSDYHYWVPRNKLMSEMGVTKNTIKSYTKELLQHNLIKFELLKDKNLAIVKYEGGQEGVNDVSIGVSVEAFDTLLTTWLTPLIIQKYYENVRPNEYFIKEIRKGDEKCKIFGELTGQRLTGKNRGVNISLKSLKEFLSLNCDSNSLVNKELLHSEFSKKEIDKLLELGELSEATSDCYQVVEVVN